MAEDVLGKLAEGARAQVLPLVGHQLVEVEPVGKLNLQKKDNFVTFIFFKKCQVLDVPEKNSLYRCMGSYPFL